MRESPLSFLGAAALIVAVLSMLLATGSWVVWFPILLALAVVAYLASTHGR